MRKSVVAFTALTLALVGLTFSARADVSADEVVASEAQSLSAPCPLRLTLTAQRRST